MHEELQRIKAAAQKAVAEFTPYDIDDENHLVRIIDNDVVHTAMVEAQGAAAHLASLIIVMENEQAERDEAANALVELESQPRLAPGTPGWWKVWGATPADIRAGDFLLYDPAESWALVVDTFEAKAAPMRVGIALTGGERFTIGALCPIVLMRKGTRNTLAGSVR